MRKKKKKKTDWEKGLGMTSVAVSGASISPGYEEMDSSSQDELACRGACQKSVTG